METFLSELKNIPGVINASSTAWNFIISRSSAGGISWDGKDPDDIVTFEVQQVNFDLIETLGISIKEGRAFSQEFSTDHSAIVFNETAIKIMGIEDPVGKTVDVWGSDREIIGVVKDFHFESMYSTISPLFLIMNPSNCKKIMVKIAHENQKETIENISALYHEFNPKFPLDYQFLDQDYQKQYEAETRIGILTKYFAGIAILISCLGLLGLAAFITERRIKEIGIRKVNGAKVSEIIRMLNGDFVKWIVTAFIIGSPIAYYVTKTWLQNFSYKIELSVWTFVFAGCLSLAIALITVSWQTYRAATVNPVKCLRNE
jgi:ABC-type antimicrobial peptide transport system permease subunit